jgi:hypothetical protein
MWSYNIKYQFTLWFSGNEALQTETYLGYAMLAQIPQF